MLVDLSGLVSPDKNRVRITTSMRLYWDQVLIARRVSDDNVRVTELTPREAELRFVGYPQPENLDGRQPSLYTYDTIAKTDSLGGSRGLLQRATATSAGWWKPSTIATSLPTTATSSGSRSRRRRFPRWALVDAEVSWPLPTVSAKTWT